MKTRILIIITFISLAYGQDPSFSQIDSVHESRSLRFKWISKVLIARREQWKGINGSDNVAIGGNSHLQTH